MIFIAKFKGDWITCGGNIVVPNIEREVWHDLYTGKDEILLHPDESAKIYVEIEKKKSSQKFNGPYNMP